MIISSDGVRACAWFSVVHRKPLHGQKGTQNWEAKCRNYIWAELSARRYRVKCWDCTPTNMEGTSALHRRSSHITSQIPLVENLLAIRSLHPFSAYSHSIVLNSRPVKVYQTISWQNTCRFLRNHISRPTAWCKHADPQFRPFLKSTLAQSSTLRVNAMLRGNVDELRSVLTQHPELFLYPPCSNPDYEWTCFWRYGIPSLCHRAFLLGLEVFRCVHAYQLLRLGAERLDSATDPHHRTHSFALIAKRANNELSAQNRR